MPAPAATHPRAPRTTAASGTLTSAAAEGGVRTLQAAAVYGKAAALLPAPSGALTVDFPAGPAAFQTTTTTTFAAYWDLEAAFQALTAPCFLVVTSASRAAPVALRTVAAEYLTASAVFQAVQVVSEVLAAVYRAVAAGRFRAPTAAPRALLTAYFQAAPLTAATTWPRGVVAANEETNLAHGTRGRDPGGRRRRKGRRRRPLPSAAPPAERRSAAAARRGFGALPPQPPPRLSLGKMCAAAVAAASQVGAILER